MTPGSRGSFTKVRAARRRPAPICGFVYWSLYVRTSNKRKLLDSHLPPIQEALEGLEFEWTILIEPESPGEFRLINYQNLTGLCVEDFVTPVLRRA